MEHRLSTVEHRTESLQQQLHDLAITVDERFRTVERTIARLESRIVSELQQVHARIDGLQREVGLLHEGLRDLSRRLDAVEQQGVATSARLDDLHEDMRQRCRLLNERVGTREDRLAA